MLQQKHCFPFRVIKHCFPLGFIFGIAFFCLDQRLFQIMTSKNFELPRGNQAAFDYSAPSRALYAVPISRAISAVASPAPAQMSKTQSSKILRRHVLRGASSRLGPEVAAAIPPRHPKKPSKHQAL